MRLLVLTSSYPTAANPGGGIFIRRMLEHLPADIQITVLTPDTQHGRSRRHFGERIVLKRFRYAPRPLQILANQFGGMPAALKSRPWLLLLLPVWTLAMFGAALMMSRKADLIHAHWSVAGLIGGLAGWITGTPVVTTLHGTDVVWAEHYFALRWVLAACIQMNTRIVTVSSAIAESLQIRYTHCSHKIQMVANGVGHEFWEISRQQARPDSKKCVFAVIGNLIPSKQVDHVIQAFNRVISSGRHAGLAIAGDGPVALELRAMVHQLGLDGHVRFYGAMAPDRIADLLARSHALVLASAHEGRPTIVMEAMAAGVLVIASDINGVRELIVDGQRGLLFKPGDIRHLGAHLAAVYDQPNQAGVLARQAHQWIKRQGLTWPNTAARYVRIYNDVLPSGTP
jgi:glycosyltransferase involved in cell wall biosynthesis